MIPTNLDKLERRAHDLINIQAEYFWDFKQVEKKKESKPTPHVNPKLSAYDRIVQLVTNDNPEVKQPQEEHKQEECAPA